MKLSRIQAPLHVVIVGAGFGGLAAAHALANRSGVRVTLIDQRNHHLFQPLLYQVATAGLNPADIAVPIRGEFSHARNVDVHMGEVEGVDFKSKRIRGHENTEMELPYDRLILACGSLHSYFGKPEWEPYAPGLKTLEQATEIRRRVLLAFEEAENEPDPVRQKEYLSFVVVGGGPTGVELAGALAEISQSVLARDFRHFDARKTRIVLVEAGPRILSMFDPRLADRAERDLRKFRVEVRKNTRVTGIDPAGVQIGEGRIAARTVIWAAGVQPARLTGKLGVPVDRSGRVYVGQDLSIPTQPDVFVIGDQAHFEQPHLNDEKGLTLPGLAPVALQQGKHVARNLLRELKGKHRLPFRYFDKGQMATIGKKRAIAQVGRLRFSGFPAWFAWLVVHVLYLVGFRNRLLVMGSWAWSYLFSKRGSRLILSKKWGLYEAKDAPTASPQAIGQRS